MISRTLERALVSAIHEAKNHNHEYVTVEHILYGLLQDKLTNEIMKNVILSQSQPNPDP